MGGVAAPPPPPPLLDRRAEVGESGGAGVVVWAGAACLDEVLAQALAELPRLGLDLRGEGACDYDADGGEQPPIGGTDILEQGDGMIGGSGT